ncbi:hypothetical protein [Lentzea cavernae]|uniref:hypothetical protein n=1 Tax=Lentzea cavernae TaxID=2020703 RepID=UPI001749D3D6|nr:hypothetical protein [Lentzea cavernae]
MILAVLFATACSSSGDTPPETPSSNASAEPTPGLHDEWAGRFDILTKISGEPRCAGEKVRTKDCANYLTPIAQTAAALEGKIQESPDAALYVDTLAELKEMAFAREIYTELKCADGGGTLDACQREMLGIVGGIPVVLATLRTADLKRR